MKNDSDESIQKKVFENNEYIGIEDIDAQLYGIIDQSLKKDSEPGLSLDFADRVVAQAMLKPVWKRVMYVFLWAMALLFVATVGMYGLLVVVDFTMPKISLDLEFVLAQKWYFVFILMVVFMVEIADMVFVRKGSTKNILSLFD